MQRSIDDLLFGVGSSDEENVDDETGDSDVEDDSSETEFIVGSTQASAWSVVNLAGPSTNTPSTPFSASLQHIPVGEDDDDDVQILTAVEAAAEMAAAARRAEENPNASRKRKRTLVKTKAEPTECTICCENCTIIGHHRLAALKCGHIFGKKCIERWVSQKHTCPNCNTVMRLTDICLLFSDHVAVVDNSGLESMTSKFEEQQKKNSILEEEVAALKQQLETETKEATRVIAELTKFKKTFAYLLPR